MSFLLLLLALAAAPRAAAAPAPAPCGVLVVADQGDATVHVLDPSSGRTLAVIPSAPAPHEVAVSHDGRWAVVTNYGDRAAIGHALTVIDLTTLRATAALDLTPHQRPHGIAFLPGDSLLLVTSETSHGVLLVGFPDGAVRRVLSTNAVGTHILAATRDGRAVWTANVGSGTATEIDVGSGRILRTVAVGPGSEGIALSPDGARLWAASMARDSAYVFDTATGERVAALAAPGHAYRVAVSPDGRRALIPAPELGLVRVIDTHTMAERDVPLANEPGGAIFSADGRTAYVPLMATGQVAAIDLDSLATTAMLPVGAAPDGMAVSSCSRR